jgi:hypothetical protein
MRRSGSEPSKAAGLLPTSFIKFGTTPNCLWTAASKGWEAAGVCSVVGMLMRFMAVLQFKGWV